MLENKSRTEIGQLGEFGLIDHLTKNIRLHQKSTEKGVGDDAAVVDHSGKKTIITTDLLTEGIHFDRSEEHTSELQSLMRISYAVFCLKKKKKNNKKKE